MYMNNTKTNQYNGVYSFRYTLYTTQLINIYIDQQHVIGLNVHSIKQYYKYK